MPRLMSLSLPYRSDLGIRKASAAETIPFESKQFISGIVPLHNADGRVVAEHPDFCLESSLATNSPLH